jgi:hypothetical protein
MRLAAGFLLLSIIPCEPTRRVIHVLIVITTLHIISSVLFVLFECWPVSYFWRQIDGSLKGSCINRDIIIKVVYALSAISAALDWAFALVPVPVIWTMHVNKRRKAKVSILLGLGIL